MALKLEQPIRLLTKQLLDDKQHADSLEALDNLDYSIIPLGQLTFVEGEGYYYYNGDSALGTHIWVKFAESSATIIEIQFEDAVQLMNSGGLSRGYQYLIRNFTSYINTNLTEVHSAMNRFDVLVKATSQSTFEEEIQIMPNQALCTTLGVTAEYLSSIKANVNWKPVAQEYGGWEVAPETWIIVEGELPEEPNTIVRQAVKIDDTSYLTVSTEMEDSEISSVKLERVNGGTVSSDYTLPSAATPIALAIDGSNVLLFMKNPGLAFSMLRTNVDFTVTETTQFTEVSSDTKIRTFTIGSNLYVIFAATGKLAKINIATGNAQITSFSAFTTPSVAASASYIWISERDLSATPNVLRYDIEQGVLETLSSSIRGSLLVDTANSVFVISGDTAKLIVDTEVEDATPPITVDTIGISVKISEQDGVCLYTADEDDESQQQARELKIYARSGPSSTYIADTYTEDYLTYAMGLNPDASTIISEGTPKTISFMKETNIYPFVKKMRDGEGNEFPYDFLNITVPIEKTANAAFNQYYLAQNKPSDFVKDVTFETIYVYSMLSALLQFKPLLNVKVSKTSTLQIVAVIIDSKNVELNGSALISLSDGVKIRNTENVAVNNQSNVDLYGAVGQTLPSGSRNVRSDSSLRILSALPVENTIIGGGISGTISLSNEHYDIITKATQSKVLGEYVDESEGTKVYEFVDLVQ